MTPEQASKLRKGDRILVEAEVAMAPAQDGGLVIYVGASPFKSSCQIECLLVREALPRPLEAGDRVRTADMKSLLVGTILAIDAGQAWVRWPAGDGSISTLSDLQRVEDGE